MKSNNSLMQIIFLVAVVLSTACGGDKNDASAAGPCSSATKAAAPVAKKDTDKKPSPSGDGQGWQAALTASDLVGYGKQVFLAKGSNTCNDCHGKDGKKGRLEQAADLTLPDTWKATKALDGDTAKVRVALRYLLGNGGKKFNQNFATDNADIGWDWSKTGATNYDIQMFGVTQSSTQSELKKIRKALKKSGVIIEKSELSTFGTKAVLAYLDSIKKTQ